MENLFTILLVLFATLAVLVVILERVGKPMDEEQQSQFSRWVPILMLIMIVAYVSKYYFFS